MAARFAGISTGYLSRLERGERNIERRGLLEDLAGTGLLGGRPHGAALPANRPGHR